MWLEIQLQRNRETTRSHLLPCANISRGLLTTLQIGRSQHQVATMTGRQTTGGSRLQSDNKVQCLLKVPAKPESLPQDLCGSLLHTRSFCSPTCPQLMQTAATPRAAGTDTSTTHQSSSLLPPKTIVDASTKYPELMVGR